MIDITNDPRPQKVSGPAPKVNVSSADKDAYYVISGSFLMETRAQNHMKNLRNNGFSDANVIQFPGSTFFSVAVGKFKTRKDAQILEKKLESENFDSFIRAVQ